MALWIADTEPLELRPNATENDLQNIIRAVYKQVLGNIHLMESQRFTNAESLLLNGSISVKGFVKLVAQSDLYFSLFCESSSAYRFIELNFKHLLGRAPQDQAEISGHVNTFISQGYKAEINSYIDSEEYILNYGEYIVPYTRGNKTQIGLKNVAFNRTFALNRGFAANDIGNQAKLITDVGVNLGTKITYPTSASGIKDNTGKRFRIHVAKATYGPRVTRSKQTFEVGYGQMSQKIRNIQKSGGKILSISEANSY